ncbi:hypothetical protein CcaCcLH18_12287 [Colletotrichum camelliae]|nr:hypothetical protein CcaCcLH18_12287 [Colletotrichum camelliae]
MPSNATATPTEPQHDSCVTATKHICGNPITMYTNPQKKVRFCHRFKGAVVRQVIQVGRQPEPAALNTNREAELQQHLWETSGLADYPELKRFRRTFGKLAAHIIEETKAGLLTKGGELWNGVDVCIVAADGGDWNSRPREAWEWCKMQMKRRAARKQEEKDDRDNVMAAAAQALMALSNLRGRVVDAHDLLQRTISLEAARDLAESSLAREEIEMAVETGSGGLEEGGTDGRAKKDALSTDVKRAQEKYEHGLKRAAVAHSEIINREDDAALDKLVNVLGGKLTIVE